MDDLARDLKLTARELGADLIGFTTPERLSDGPPSADPTYSMPGTRAVISFAKALDPRVLDAFIRKESWLPHCEDRKAVVRRLYEIGDRLAEMLRSHGFRAHVVDLNNNYRAEPGAADVAHMTEFHPEFSHRYAAVAAGLGRLGWSGNLMTREYGARVELASVLTDAPLDPDDPMPDEEHPCDRCRACVGVCPVGMIPARDEITVRIAGVEDTIARKRPNTCCWIGCTGYEGLSRSGTWSNWSPYRLDRPLPETKAELDALCIGLQCADPQMADPDNAFSDYRQAMFNADWTYYTVCGFCRSVCTASREERLAHGKAVRVAGKAALSLDGSHVVDRGDGVMVDTPFGLKVVVPRDELEKAESYGADPRPGFFPLDDAVITYLTSETSREARRRALDAESRES